MIVDLDKALYVVDSQTHEHEVSTIDIINKVVTTVDGETFEYGTCPLTIIIKA
jgi:hypothetical protein